jgi:quinolinate synthase
MMKDQIRALLKEKNAILLAHNYQPPEIQDTADMCGDSLELSIRAGETSAEVIVFCGVHFMAETASIISPDKTVLLPRTDAGCLMADMIDAKSLAAKKASLPPMPVVTYVNSTAEVKALSTICCTSANVIQVVNSLPDKEMLLAPDRNLALYAASKTDKNIHIWEGYCPTHDQLSAADVKKAKADHPDALVMAHPECPPEVLALADAVESTSGMLRFAKASDRSEFIVGTEVGLLHAIQKQNPNKVFHALSSKAICPDMKRIGLKDIVHCLENFSGQVKVPEEIRKPALAAVEKMIQLSR